MTTPGERRYVLAVRRVDPKGIPLVRIDQLATESGLHPELVIRLISLGALVPEGGTRSDPLFAPNAAARLARIIRLRRDLGVNYAGALLAVDLLARIELLEDMLERVDAAGRPADGSVRRRTG